VCQRGLGLLSDHPSCHLTFGRQLQSIREADRYVKVASLGVESEEQG